MKHFLINLLPNRIAWFFSRPYVAGDSMDEAIIKIENLWKEGKFSTIDLLGESVSKREEVDLMTNIYLELTKKLSKKSKYASISVKPTALGITISKNYCLENLRKILVSAQSSDVMVTMDMEDSSLTDITLEIYKELLSEFPTFGIVVQSRLFRTKNDIINILPDNSRVRICIGIYLEPPEIALTDKKIMKEKIIEYSKLMLDKNIIVEIATHDDKTVREALKLFESRKISKDRVEFQFLHKLYHISNELKKGHTVSPYILSLLVHYVTYFLVHQVKIETQLDLY